MFYRSFGVVASYVFLLFAFTLSQILRAQSVATARNDLVRQAPASSVQFDVGSADPVGKRTDGPDLSRQGRTLVYLGLYKESVGFFEKAAQAMPDSSTAWLNLSIVYDRLDRISESLAAAKQALEVDVDNRDARTQVCDMTIYSKLYSEAFACYGELEKTGPLDDRLLSNYGMASMAMGDFAKARSILEPISTRQPYNADLQNALGVICFKQKNLPEALAYLKRAIETAPDRGLFRYNMALAQMQGKNRAAVLSQYRLLRQSDPELARQLEKYIFKDKLLFVDQE
jgi:tetratricopeptide (TPR) repeat protein